MCIRLTLSFFTCFLNLLSFTPDISVSAFEQRVLSVFLQPPDGFLQQHTSSSVSKYCMILHQSLKHDKACSSLSTNRQSCRPNSAVSILLEMLFQSSIFLYGSWLEWEGNVTLKDESSSRTVATKFTVDSDKRGLVTASGNPLLHSQKNPNSCCTTNST